MQSKAVIYSCKRQNNNYFRGAYKEKAKAQQLTAENRAQFKSK